MNIVDIIVIAVLAVFALIGFVKGFLNSLLSLFGNVASIALAIVIAKPCAKFFNSVFHIVEWLDGLAVNGISSMLPTDFATPLSSAQVVDYIKVQRGLLGKLVSSFVKEGQTFESLDILKASLTESLGGLLSVVFTAIVMFILIRVAIFLLSRIFNAITKARAMNGMDRVLGILLGALKGAVIVTCVLSVIYTIAPIVPSLNDYIVNAPFTNWIYGYTNKFVDWLIQTIDIKSIIANIKA